MLCVNITIIEDLAIENAETFFVELVLPTGAMQLLDQSSVVILDTSGKDTCHLLNISVVLDTVESCKDNVFISYGY